MCRMSAWVFALVMAFTTSCFADDTEPSKIFEKVIAAYTSMETYKAEGTSISDIDMGGKMINTSTEFSIILKKPNLYRISWNQKSIWTQKSTLMPDMVQSGAVWSDGTQPYLYIGGAKAYSKMANDLAALGSATGISGGAAFTIPSIFLSVFKEQLAPFSRLTNPKLVKVEPVENEGCYVITGSSASSKQETFWISKSRYLIIKYSQSLEVPEGGRTVPEITDEQLTETIKEMGQEVTEERKQQVREMMKKDLLQTTKMKGSLTELHVHVSSPELNKADFQFALPEGTALKESLFGGAFSGSSGGESTSH